MANRTTVAIINGALVVLAITISFGIVISGIEASDLRNALIVINWFVWFAFVATYPIATLQSGAVIGVFIPFQRSYRDKSPARFWTGLIFLTLLWVFVLGLVSLYSYMAWYFGA